MISKPLSGNAEVQDSEFEAQMRDVELTLRRALAPEQGSTNKIHTGSDDEDASSSPSSTAAQTGFEAAQNKAQQRPPEGVPRTSTPPRNQPAAARASQTTVL